MAEPIVGINRTRVSPYSFLGRSQQQQRDDSDTTVALRQNQVALLNVNNSLTRIAEQVSVLSASLQGITTQIKETSTLETLKEQQKARQEQILAERQIREGKESQVETKIQAALVAPLQKVGAKAQGSLANLGRFFNILLGGFLLNKILTTAADLSENGNLTLKNLGDKIVKDLLVVGGIFLGVNGGFSAVLGTITRLASTLTRVAFRGLLLRPIQLVFGLAGGILGKIKSLIPKLGLGAAATTTAAAAAASVAPSTAASAAATTAGAGANATRAGAPRAGKPGGPMIGARTAGFTAAIVNLFTGGSIGESGTAGVLAALPSLVRLGGFPGLAASIVLPFLAPTIYGTMKPTVEKYLPQLGLTKDQLFSSLVRSNDRNLEKPKQQTNVSTLNIGEQDQSQIEVPSTSGQATFLPEVSSFNPDNFYVLYSHMQYNVVG